MDVDGGWEGKRRFRKATSGKKVPVSASTVVKKNIQRVPPLGSIKFKVASNPPQPITMRMIAVGKKNATGSDLRVSMILLVFSGII